MKYLQYGIIVVVVASVVAGLYFAGSPNRARALRFDDRRIGDLQSLQSQILWHWQSKKVLPKDLAALEESQPGYEVPVDPETKAAYVYRVTGTLSFELCALFALPTQQGGYDRGYSYAYPQPYFTGVTDWKHETGLTCYTRTIDKEQYDKDQAGMMKPVPVY